MKKLILLFVLISTLLVGCKKEDNKSSSLKESLLLNKSSITLLAGETAQISTSISGCIFKSDNPIIANVSPDGKVTAYYVGSARISVTNGSDLKYCDVKVNQKYSMYKEPYLEFGSSKVAVKANEFRTLSNETTDALTYEGENSYILGVIYTFSGSKLNAAGCLIPNAHASLLGNFLTERYVFVKSDLYKNRIYYVSPDQKLIVVVEVASVEYSLIAYAPITSSKAEDVEINKTFDLLRSNIK